MRCAKLVEREQGKPLIDSIIPLDNVAKAHERVEQGGVRGKVVLDTNASSCEGDDRCSPIVVSSIGT